MVHVIQITGQGFAQLQDGTFRYFDEVVVDGGPGIPIVKTGSGDISDIWDNSTGYSDWAMQGTQLAAGADLVTSLIKSLFTERQAAADDVIPDGTTNRRGWWADPTMGSRLWLLERAKLTPDLVKKAEDYCNEALRWMIDDGVAASVSVVAAIQMPSALGVQIIVKRRDGTSLAKNYAWVWKG